MFTFVTGGLRSGKSAYALRRASELGPPPWTYISVISEGNNELKGRLANSRRDQDAIWNIVEAPARLDAAVEPEKLAGYGAVVLDGITAWLWQRLEKNSELSDTEYLQEAEQLTDRLYRSTVPIVVVTTEAGLGFASAAGPDRRFLDLAGRVNQILAERAQSVVLMISGVPLRLR